ncbi:haloacid dehalogenase [Lactococcus hodotermopsidis]|uniref:Haloacid dehalogenase n=1 Tax=Pseudolactococcus hodotermopsidis TaxID=2709157 RepID=A0A6A0BDI3_9LACT|nr:Cof-type HAD-IIB family hydrolase [Lactococcus hodotermopsidis]GFH43472.1 haloacid dehalogenase [Lactococcus hodotermopsidis]
MDIKAVFFDLDGTLFTGTRGIAASTKRSIDEMRRKGILVGLATGRGPSFVMPLLENLRLDFAVTYNGQYIFTLEETIDTTPIDKSSLRRILTYAQENHVDISLGGANGVKGSGLMKFGESKTGQVLAGLLPEKLSKAATANFKKIVRKIKPQSNDLTADIRQPIYQVMMIASEHETDSFALDFPDITVTRSNPYSADIVTHGNSKIKGIEKVAQKFGFTLAETMAFGDSDNDLEMLAGVGFGIAMGNATPLVKKRANYVTDTNNADGIAKALAHYGLINLKNAKSFLSKDESFNKVKAFHALMDGRTQEMPRVYQPDEAGHRAGFKVEEIVEFLHAASDGDSAVFADLTADLHHSIDRAVKKIETKNTQYDSVLIGEVDALLDLLYFTYGSFALMGVDPYEIFNAVHDANMGKIFPDGKPHFDSETHKILKPDNWAHDFAPEKKIDKELQRQIRVAISKFEKK